MKFLGMDPTLGLADEFNKHVKAESEAARIIEGSGFYRVNCPNCSTQVLMEQLMESGCYVCGYKPE